MDYNPSDSSGTDDDLPPTHQNRIARGGRASGNGRAPIVGGIAYNRANSEMETQIHRLEQEAYSSVLRAFKAQSDAITWEKESLITELRKELRVTDDEHRVLLNRVNADDVIRRIREWRKSGGAQAGFLNNSQPVHDSVPSPSVSASRKKQKTSQAMPSLSLNAPSPALHSQTVAPLQPSSSAVKRGAPPGGARGKKPKTAAGPVEAASFDPLVGRKIWTRWPEDNSFYEAIITDYNPVEGLHALTYDMNTHRETWEWVNLKEMDPDDIRWEGDEIGLSRRAGRGGPLRGVKKSMGRGGALSGVGRGRGSMKNQAKKEFPSSQNGIGKKGSDSIELLHTETLIKEVERVFSSSHPDAFEIERAKKALKDHEQSLIDAIARLADASDGESEDVEHQLLHGQPLARDKGWKNRQHPEEQHPTNYHDGTAGAAADGEGAGYIHAGEEGHAI